MKHSLTIVYVTSRPEPKIEWFMDSLHRQMMPNETVNLTFVSFFDLSAREDIFSKVTPRPDGINKLSNIRIVKPKPTIWQGEFKITKDEHWAASNARNTGICLCKTEWIAFLDDRCVLMPTWLQAIREAMDKNYAVFGSYEKRVGMTVENGAIIHGGTIIGKDNREGYAHIHSPNQPMPCGGEWCYGCTLALPLEWALQVNGFEELCDGLSMEDVIFGLMLQRNDFPLRYDSKMMMIEDRSPEFIGATFRRTSKERFPNDKQDKGHKALEIFGRAKHSKHEWNLREIRNSVLSGGEFEIPDPNKNHVDWFDGQPIRDF